MSTNAPAPEVLTVDQAAELMHVDRKTIHQWLAQGLAHQRLSPRIIRIQRDELLSFRRTAAA